jgi:hypothetical protein
LTIFNSQIRQSQALTGQGTLLIDQTASTFTAFEFSDNKAALTTHGIVI